MKKYKFITIEREKPTYIVTDKKRGQVVGHIYCSSDGKMYGLNTEGNWLISASCLRDIIDFIDNHAKEKV